MARGSLEEPCLELVLELGDALPEGGRRQSDSAGARPKIEGFCGFDEAADRLEIGQHLYCISYGYTEVSKVSLHDTHNRLYARIITKRARPRPHPLEAP